MNRERWVGSRILVVEDSLLYSEVLCDYLREQRLVPVGPAGRVDTACALARENTLDGAIVDLKLADQFSFPICSILAEREVPFLFLTGYGELSVIPTEYRSAPLVCKPFDAREMHDALQSLLDRKPPGRGH